jgi:hypothetical protein
VKLAISKSGTISCYYFPYYVRLDFIILPNENGLNCIRHEFRALYLWRKGIEATIKGVIVRYHIGCNFLTRTGTGCQVPKPTS